MELGSVVLIYAATAGYRKYHLCLKLADEHGAARFLYINSDPRFADTLAVPNAQVPCIPPNDTGVSCFSFSMVPRYSEQQLATFQAEVKGSIDLSTAQQLRAFADGVRALAKADLDLVKSALDEIVHRLTPEADEQDAET